MLFDGNMAIEELLDLADKMQNEWDDAIVVFVEWLEGRTYESLSPAQKRKVLNLYT